MLPFLLVVLERGPQLHALIFQWDPKLSDPLLILEWIFLSHQPKKDHHYKARNNSSVNY